MFEVAGVGGLPHGPRRRLYRGYHRPPRFPTFGVRLSLTTVGGQEPILQRLDQPVEFLRLADKQLLHAEQVLGLMIGLGFCTALAVSLSDAQPHHHCLGQGRRDCLADHVYALDVLGVQPVEDEAVAGVRPRHAIPQRLEERWVGQG